MLSGMRIDVQAAATQKKRRLVQFRAHHGPRGSHIEGHPVCFYNLKEKGDEEMRSAVIYIEHSERESARHRFSMLWAAACSPMISSWFSGNAADTRSTAERTEPREAAPARSRMLIHGPCRSPIQPWAFVKGALKISSIYVVETWGVFRDEATGKIKKHSLLEPVTGNFTSLLSRENSQFFLSRDG